MIPTLELRAALDDLPHYRAWSAYLGKPESIPANLHMNIHWPEVRLETEYESWTPYYENTICVATQQSLTAHTIITAKQMTAIQEILGSVVHTLCSSSVDLVRFGPTLTVD